MMDIAYDTLLYENETSGRWHINTNKTLSGCIYIHIRVVNVKACSFSNQLNFII